MSSSYRRADVRLRYDVPGIVAALRAGDQPDLGPAPVRVDLYYRIGVETFIATTNGEEIVHFMGGSKEQVCGHAATGGAGDGAARAPEAVAR